MTDVGITGKSYGVVIGLCPMVSALIRVAKRYLMENVAAFCFLLKCKRKMRTAKWRTRLLFSIYLSHLYLKNTVG